jgi:hypothetical protein
MNRQPNAKNQISLRLGLACHSAVALMLCAASIAVASQNDGLRVSVSHPKARRGETIEIRIQVHREHEFAESPLRAVLLRPIAGIESLSLQRVRGQADVYGAEIKIAENAPFGLYVVHAWTGEMTNPSAVGKATFLLGNLVADFFVANFVDEKHPADDVEEYLKDFRRLGGNFLVAHNLITATKAYYPSKISRTDVAPGSVNDIVELVLSRADRDGIAVLLSVSWDMTRQSHFKDRMGEIKAIMEEMYALYKHHPSLAGFYSYQEGSGTYYVPYVREFSKHVKSLDANLLAACAPHVDDPLLAGYLSTVEELDIIIYQAGVMASYRTDNRKKYPLRRVKDFCALGAGAKRLQNKIAILHVELFGYLENHPNPDILAASYDNIYGQILSAATVTDADGISLFSYHAHIYLPLKKYPQVARSRQAVVDGLKAFELIAAQIFREPNPLAVYFPYSDWIVERWPNYFLPALDAFRVLGIPVDVLPYAPPLEESVYPYYPFHMNTDVLARLLKERTVLVLPNVSGFQQTDSDLIKAFVEQGGVIVAFGPQIPMGRSYERKELFGGDETAGTRTHTAVVVKEAVGDRVEAGSHFALSGIQLPSWTANGARVIATFEDGSAAITLNKYGQGMIVTIIPDAWTAAQHIPELVRETIARAMSSTGVAPLVDILGTNEETDMAVGRTPEGFRVAVINHNSGEMEVLLRPLKTSEVRASGWVDLVSRDKLETSTADRSIKVKIPGRGFRALEFR